MAVLLYIFLLIAPQAEMEQALYRYQQGNEYYQKGEYQKAADEYKSAIEMGYESPELYFNLGNAYFKQKEVGLSILNYERALKIAPRDKDISFNLQIAQLYVVDKIVEPPSFITARIWQFLKNTFSKDHLAILMTLSYITTLIFLIIFLLGRKVLVKRISNYFFKPFLILFIFFAVLFVVRLNEDRHNSEAIILASKVDVKSSPSIDATDVFALHVGVKVRTFQQSGEYIRISLPDGKVGWLLKRSLEII